MKITNEVVAGMIAHARAESPRECCGLLAGEDGLIDECVRTRNVRASAVTYEIDPGEHISARKNLRARGRFVLGAYHSHPRTAAVPSPTDVAEAYYDRDFLYVIVSLEREPPDVRAYRFDRGELIEAMFDRTA